MSGKPTFQLNNRSRLSKKNIKNSRNFNPPVIDSPLKNRQNHHILLTGAKIEMYQSSFLIKSKREQV